MSDSGGPCRPGLLMGGNADGCRQLLIFVKLLFSAIICRENAASPHTVLREPNTDQRRVMRELLMLFESA